MRSKWPVSQSQPAVSLAVYFRTLCVCVCRHWCGALSIIHCQIALLTFLTMNTVSCFVLVYPSVYFHFYNQLFISQQTDIYLTRSFVTISASDRKMISLYLYDALNYTWTPPPPPPPLIIHRMYEIPF